MPPPPLYFRRLAAAPALRHFDAPRAADFLRQRFHDYDDAALMHFRR